MATRKPLVIINGVIQELPVGDDIAMPFDDYASSEFLADQTSSGAVLTFTFTSAVHQIWATMDGADTEVGRVTTGATTPTATVGAPLYDVTPLPLTVTTDTVKVLAPAGAVVTVWGFRR